MRIYCGEAGLQYRDHLWQKGELIEDASLPT